MVFAESDRNQAPGESGWGGADAGKEIDPDKVVRRRTEGQEEGGGGQHQKAGQGQALHAQQAGDQAQGQGQGAGSQQKGAVNQPYFGGIGPRDWAKRGTTGKRM